MIPALLTLVALAVLATATLAALSRTPAGWATPGTGLLIRAAKALKKLETGTLDLEKRRALVRSNIALVDGRPNPKDGIKAQDLTLSLGAREVTARLYLPASGLPRAFILYYHGGGFAMGCVQANDRLVRDLCCAADAGGLSLEYRLAPEHPFPAAHDDALDAYAWVVEAMAAGRLPKAPVVLCGDSAGGNLAASTCIAARDRGLPIPAAQILLYPVTDFSRMDTPSYEAYADGYMLTKAEMEWFRDAYMPDPKAWSNPRVSILLAEDLRRLPPALIMTAGMDPLRDEGEAYAKRLAQAGVRVEARRYVGRVHGFAQMGRFVRVARRVPAIAAAFIRSCLSGSA